MSNSCIPFYWTPSTIDSLEPIRIVCIIGMIIHGLFWIQFFLFSKLREISLIWLFSYLITDLILFIRFFLLFGIRSSSICLDSLARDILCYFEASSKFYLYTVQAYLILGFNICRYKRIVSNQNIYVEKVRWIILSHLLIYVLPIINVIVQFVSQLARISRRRGASCDILYNMLFVQIFNVVITYVFPVFFNLIVIGLAIRFVSSVEGVTSQQIIHLRQKRQRILLIQTIVFYTIWLFSWSPDFIAFQFIYVHSDPGIITSLLSHINTALDPILIGILDVRFLTPLKTRCKRMKRNQKIGTIQPTVNKKN